MGLEYLNNIGSVREAFRTDAKNPVQQVLKDFAETQIEATKEALINGKPKHQATGALAQSIAFTINFDEIVTIDFLMLDYWDFINSGVKGLEGGAITSENAFGESYSFKSLSVSPDMIDSFVGTGGLDGWMRAKGISSLNYVDQFGNNITEELVTDDDFRSAAYVLARATKKKGISGNKFVTNTFNEEALLRFEEQIITAIENRL